MEFYDDSLGLVRTETSGLMRTTNLLIALFIAFSSLTAMASPLSPTAATSCSKNSGLYLASGASDRVVVVGGVETKTRFSIATPGVPTGLRLSQDYKRLYVTCAAPQSRVCIVDLKKETVIATMPAAQSAMAPVVSPDGNTLYVRNRFDNDFSVIGLEKQCEICRIHVEREPMSHPYSRPIGRGDTLGNIGGTSINS